MRESPSFESVPLPCHVCMYAVARAPLDFLVSDLITGFSLSLQFSFCSLPFSTFLSLPTPISTDVAYFSVFALCVFEHLPHPFYLILRPYLLVTPRVKQIVFWTNGEGGKSKHRRWRQVLEVN